MTIHIVKRKRNPESFDSGRNFQAAYRIPPWQVGNPAHARIHTTCPSWAKGEMKALTAVKALFNFTARA